MSYSQALEEQIRQVRLWESDYGAMRASGALSSFFPKPNQARDFMADHLKYGESYYLAADLCPAICGAAANLTDSNLPDSVLPSRMGWLWFAQPVVIPGLQAPADSCMTTRLRAVSWAVSQIEPNGRTYVRVDGNADPDAALHSITLLAYFDCTEESWPEFVSIDAWPFGERISDIRPALESFEHLDAVEREDRISAGNVISPFVRKLFLSFCAFIEQRILVSSVRPVERHARKRLERSGGIHEPVVRVVELRRKHTPHEYHGDTEPVAWSHRWMVGGHWRRQFYPSLNENRPRWIMPYVKGPEDKPLKPPRAKVFAVVR